MPTGRPDQIFLQRQMLKYFLLFTLIPLAHSTNLVCLILLCKKWKARICGTIIPALYSFLCIAGMDLEKSRKSFILLSIRRQGIEKGLPTNGMVTFGKSFRNGLCRSLPAILLPPNKIPSCNTC